MTVNRERFFIGNEWRQPSSMRTFDIVNASTGALIATAPEAVEADVDAAVAAARHAFDHSDWPTMAPTERASIMRRFLEVLARRGNEIAEMVSLQNGMPIAVSTMLEAKFPSAVLQYYADLIDAPETADIRPSQMGKETRVEHSPIGVVAAIVPWNFPVALAISKVAPAMAAGCTMVIKPSPCTVLDSYIVAETALEAGVPAGVLNWVPADREVGAYLVSHPGIDKVTFTGSTPAGRSIARTCGELLRPVTLELGGKSAAIVLDDANMDLVLQSLPMVSLLNNGQACFNCTRILAPQSRYREVVDAIAGMMSGLKVGDAMDPETHVGPMATSEHRDRVETFIAKGREEAKLVVGGGRPANLQAGWFVEPTLFADVDNRSTIAQQEIFGPVLCVTEYSDEADAVRLANDSQFGLGGTVWSRDGERALATARKVHSGTVGINGYMPSLGAPFGGVKASGIGREYGPDAIASYQQVKSIYVMG